MNLPALDRELNDKRTPDYKIEMDTPVDLYQ